MKKKCYIISAGDCAGINFLKEKEDFIIAVDGGYLYAKENHIVPDLVIGDFDSLGYIPDDKNVIVHRPEKDDTDTGLAVKEAIRRGYHSFVFYGVLGGRLDHTIANLQLMWSLTKKGYTVEVIDEHAIINFVIDATFILQGQKGGVFSVFTLDSAAEHVSIKNAKYELNDTELTNVFPVGISNEFVGEDVEITVGNGSLMIIRPLA